MGRGAWAAKVRGGWRQWTEDEARAALGELAGSGESLAEFARSRGFSAQRVRYWRKRLGATPSLPAFVPVRLSVAAPTTVAPTIDIVLGGITVRVREDLDVEHLARIVEALRGRAGRC